MKYTDNCKETDITMLPVKEGYCKRMEDSFLDRYYTQCGNSYDTFGKEYLYCPYCGKKVSTLNESNIYWEETDKK